MDKRQAKVDQYAEQARKVCKAMSQCRDDLMAIVNNYDYDPTTGAELYYQRIGDQMVTIEEKEQDMLLKQHEQGIK